MKKKEILKKKYNKSILKLKYLNAEINYVEEIFAEAMPSFTKEVNCFLEENQDIVIRKDSFLGIDGSFHEKESFENNNINISKADAHSDDINDEDINKKNKNIPHDIKFLYRKIAMITHPDRYDDSYDEEEREKMLSFYKSAINAFDNKKWFTIIDIAIELNIDIPEPTEEVVIMLDKESGEIRHRIQKTTKTHLWKWCQESSEETKKTYIENYLRKSGIIK
jgi:hypothetical protein